MGPERTEPERLFSLQQLASVGDDFPLYAPHFLVLSYFSELFRFYALGIEGPDADLAYDGDISLLRAVCGLVMPGFPVDERFDPTTVASLADGLSRIDGTSYPTGDSGPLGDYFSDYGPGGEALEDVCRGCLAWLTTYYRDATSRGYGIRIIG